MKMRTKLEGKQSCVLEGPRAPKESEGPRAFDYGEGTKLLTYIQATNCEAFPYFQMTWIQSWILFISVKGTWLIYLGQWELSCFIFCFPSLLFLLYFFALPKDSHPLHQGTQGANYLHGIQYGGQPIWLPTKANCLHKSCSPSFLFRKPSLLSMDMNDSTIKLSPIFFSLFEDNKIKATLLKWLLNH